MVTLIRPGQRIISPPGVRVISGTQAARSGGAYTDKVLGYSPIAYWPMSETSGLVADNLEGTAARDGSYTAQVALNDTLGPDGVNNAPYWDNNLATADLNTASLDSALDLDEFSIVLWMKIKDAATWTTNSKQIFALYGTPSSNRLQFYIDTSARIIFYRISSTGGSAIRTSSAQNSLDWLCLAATVSLTADEVRYFINGAQEGATITGNGAFNGAISLFSVGQAVTSLWYKGWQAHYAVLPVLTPAEILDLATI